MREKQIHNIFLTNFIHLCKELHSTFDDFSSLAHSGNELVKGRGEGFSLFFYHCRVTVLCAGEGFGSALKVSGMCVVVLGTFLKGGVSIEEIGRIHP